MCAAPLYETFPVIKVEPRLSYPEDGGGGRPGGGRVPVLGASQRARERRATAGAPWRPPTTAGRGRGRGRARGRTGGRRPSGRAGASASVQAPAASAHARSRPRIDAQRAEPRPPPPTPRRWSMVLRDVAARRSARAESAEPPPDPPPPPTPPPVTPPGGAICEKRTRKRRQRKPDMPPSRSPSQTEKKRRRRTPKVKKLVLVSDGNGMWEVKHKRHSRRRQNVRQETCSDHVTERSSSKSVSSPTNVESANGEWSDYNEMNGDILLDGDVQTRIAPISTNTQMRDSLSDTEVYEPMRNSSSDTEVYERLQPQNVHVSISDCNLTNNIDAYVPARPGDAEADPDVIIVEEVDDADTDVVIVEEVDKEEPDVIIVEEVTNQPHGKEWCGDRETEEAIDVSSPSHVRTELADSDCSRELVPLGVPESIPENYIGDPDTGGERQQTETQQWHQPRLPVDQWEQQPIRHSPTEADYEMFSQTLSQIPLYQQIQRQRIVQDVLETNHKQLSRASPQPQELVPSNEYRWHQPQAFPDRCQNQNQNRPPGCRCGSAHETTMDRPTVAIDRQTLLRDSRLVLCEEQAEKETRIDSASQFLKTFHGVHSECEDSSPQEAVFQEPETPYRQHRQYPKSRQELSEEFQYQHSYRSVKTEEYQFVKTIFTNSIPSQRYIAAQSVAVDRQVIYKEEYKIIPPPQLEWNISDGCSLGDMNLDLNFSRATLVDVSP